MQHHTYIYSDGKGSLFAVGNYWSHERNALMNADEYENVRTREQSPYGHDPYVMFMNSDEPTDTVYHYSMMKSDLDRYGKLAKRHFKSGGQMGWHAHDIKTIQAFVRDFLGDQSIVICRLICYVNRKRGYPNGDVKRANGYENYRIDYRREKRMSDFDANWTQERREAYEANVARMARVQEQGQFELEAYHERQKEFAKEAFGAILGGAVVVLLSPLVAAGWIMNKINKISRD